MFGSDQMRWPEAIGWAVEAIEEAPFLSEPQKRDIFYHNAARFLRMDETVTHELRNDSSALGSGADRPIAAAGLPRQVAAPPSLPKVIR